MMPSSPGRMTAYPLTNGHSASLPLDITPTVENSTPEIPGTSDRRHDVTLDCPSDEDAPGEILDEREAMAIESSSSEDDDALGEPDGDYDSETPPPQQDDSRPSSSSSQQSRRSLKRKLSTEVEEYITKNPELYGLRRSVRGPNSPLESRLTIPQGRARPNRRIVDDSDDEDQSASDGRRKRQRTNSRKVSNMPTPAYQSVDSDSSSDDYVNARRNIPSKKQKQRQMLIAAGHLPPSQAEVRFSSRRTKQVTNYNEEDDDDFEEDEDEDLTPNYAWTMAAEDTGPVIDKVLDHRPKEGLELDPASVEKTDFEYLIKWQNKAHYHSTWESYETLSSYKGARKLDNYFKGPVLNDMYYIQRKKIDPEEYEQHMVAREAERQSQADFHIVERVIGTRDGEDETEYYVKWKGLTYEFCTWESASLVSSLAQGEIDRYLDRSSKLPSSDRKESNLNTRRKFTKLDEQPDYIKFGKLRSFQLHGLNFLAHNWCKGNNVILADEMGLGKTVQTVSFMNWLRHDRRQDGPFICVVPLSTMPAWADTFNNWTPDINYVIYTGRDEARKIIQEYELLVDGRPDKVKFNVLLTTYEYVLADYQFLSSLKWQFLAVDEAHRLKNRDSQLYDRLRQFHAPSRLLITGTPIQNTLGELSALMDFLMPGKIVVDDNFDLASEDASRKLAELSEAIQPYMIRRTKEKVENDLPPKTEKILRVELSDIQLDYYKNILTRNYEALNEGGQGQKQSLLNIVMELKKASNHALLFPNAEARFLKENATKEETLKTLITTSGKMMLLDRLLAKLKADGHRVLIFSQMVHMLDILSDYLRLRNYPFQRLDGTVPAPERKIAIDHFNAPGSEDFAFCLSTRAGGLGINLMTADTVVIFDSDWNPQADLQAMARAHRIGQQKPVTVYRLVSKDTIEEEILERARNKRMLEFITIQRGVTDRQQKEFNDKLNRAAGEPNSADDINQILKRRGQKMFEQSGNQKKLEELDIDSLLANAEEHKTEQAAGLTSDGGEEFLKNFEYTDVKIDLEWDDIIPKDELDVVKAEIQHRKEEEETQRILAENAPRKRKAAPTSDREQRAAKKRAREATRQLDADGDATEDGSESSGNDDPKRPLTTKELRSLIRAYERYGSLEERGDDIVRDAKLVGRDREVLKATLDEVIAKSRELMKEELARRKALEGDGGRVVTKKDKKTVLFTFKDVKNINAETILDRPVEMKLLKEAVDAAPDWRSFRVPDATKYANYTCAWGAREDGMLCVGIARHGYGAWTAIRDDPELGMSDKFFLEEHRVDKKEERSKAEEKNAKSPGAVHLVRRANYLLTLLKAKMGSDPNAKRLIENHHRNNKKHHLHAHRRSENGLSVSRSPAPSAQSRKASSRDTERPGHRPHGQGKHGDQYRPTEGHRKELGRNNKSNIERLSQQLARSGTPELRRNPSIEAERPRPTHGQGDNSHRASIDSPSTKPVEKKSDDYVERRMKPVRDNLGRLRKASIKNIPDKEKMIKVLKVELIAIGNFIRAETRDNKELEDRLWTNTLKYWPRSGVTVDQVKTMYNRMLGSEMNGKQGVKQSNGQSTKANGT
ncbi:uncharacterized protein EI97DRAFT_452925 [Westerdykella ornata]|uniref:Chromodomain helicase-like protein n=1 Tax=Westerdykella ornata TaxID=318751 RepID=A0A6A6JAB2_WESOR|nr:uncharacterized protein EI97DRAFT_452925 [Westerdykella ornata]KAF2272566.1 hypothetical protein EI97DRAFT_452925 [Westerdykella ornata]